MFPAHIAEAYWEIHIRHSSRLYHLWNKNFILIRPPSSAKETRILQVKKISQSVTLLPRSFCYCSRILYSWIISRKALVTQVCYTHLHVLHKNTSSFLSILAVELQKIIKSSMVDCTSVANITGKLKECVVFEYSIASNYINELHCNTT